MRNAYVFFNENLKDALAAFYGMTIRLDGNCISAGTA